MQLRIHVPMARAFAWAGLAVFVACNACSADDFLLADGQAWPGRILACRNGVVAPFHDRTNSLPDGLVPRVQSISVLPSGEVAFCSGLDRTVLEADRLGEHTLHHGGYLARQVRTDRDGTLYWSGLETPLGGNPLPDGFIYALDPNTHEVRTVLTFSQGDVGRDWWGSFDVVNGRIFVATLSGPSQIYDVSVSPVRHVCTLPFAITAFRFAADGSLYATNGQGQLYRVADVTNSAPAELVLDAGVRFVDFDFIRAL